MRNIKSVFDLKQDNTNNTVVVMNSEIAEINEGSLYEANIYRSDVSNGTQYKIHFTPPASKYMHFKFDTWSRSTSAKIRTFLYENITATTTGGTAAIAYNKNRNATNLTSGVSITKSATMTSGNAVAIDWSVQNGYFENGTISFNKKWILKPGVKYALIVKNTTPTTATTDVNIKIQFSLKTEATG